MPLRINSAELTFIRALRTEMQPSRDRCCCRQIRPTALTPHDGPCPAASSRRGLAASKQGGRRYREDHDPHLPHVPALSSSSLTPTDADRSKSDDPPMSGRGPWVLLVSPILPLIGASPAPVPA